MIDRNIKIQIALPFFLIIISFFTLKLNDFKPQLTPTEMRLMGFVPEAMIEIPERQTFIVKNLKSPIEIVKATKVSPPTLAIADVEKPLELKVSMIVIGEKKMAIVNGIIVNEGASINGMKVVEIAKDRILLKGAKGGKRWVYLEGIK